MVVNYCGVCYVIVVSNVIVVLYIVCFGLNFGVGDFVWISLNIFVVLVNCVCYCGVDVGFIDIDFLIWNMLVEYFVERFGEVD